jgi:biotin carboxyl carrier protein
MRFKVRIAGEEREMEVVRQGDSFVVRRDGEEVAVRLIHNEGAAFVLEYDDLQNGQPVRRRIRAAGFLEGGRRQLWVNGSNVTYERVQERKSPGPAAEPSLSATIPAVVSEILVEVGQTVKAGDRLILLESMKMILPIQAPHAGAVRQIHCHTGQAVQPGVALIELEES